MQKSTYRLLQFLEDVITIYTGLYEYKSGLWKLENCWVPWKMHTQHMQASSDLSDNESGFRTSPSVSQTCTMSRRLQPEKQTVANSTELSQGQKQSPHRKRSNQLISSENWFLFCPGIKWKPMIHNNFPSIPNGVMFLCLRRDSDTQHYPTLKAQSEGKFHWGAGESKPLTALQSHQQWAFRIYHSRHPHQ